MTSSRDKGLMLRWAEALESGEYIQTTGELHAGGTCYFCVLGVLGDVMGIPRDDMYYDRRARNGDAGKVNDTYKKIEAATGHASDFFYRLNDQGKMTFPQIAGFIRKHYGLPAKEA